MLRPAAFAYLAANLVHTGDHLRQGLDGLTTEIFLGGTALTLGAVLLVVLVLRDHAQAPMFAVVLGFSAVAGIAASHLAPHWSALSDSYPEIGADALSWIVVIAEMGAALWLGISGLRALRLGAPTPRAG